VTERRNRNPGVAEGAGTKAGPLAGIRILEVGHILAGPYSTVLLADLGAEVRPDSENVMEGEENN